MNSAAPPALGAPEKPIGILGASALSLAVLAGFVGVLQLLARSEAAALALPVDAVLARAQEHRPSLAVAQAAGLSVALGVGLLVYRRRAPLRASLRLRGEGLRPIALCLLAGFALQFPLAELGNLLRTLWPMEPEQQRALARLLAIRSVRDAVEVVALVLVVAPLGEELLFRGLLLPGLRARYGRAGAVVSSAALFGAVHVEPVSAIVAGAAGLLLGAVALRADSTLPAIALHLGFNAAPVLLPHELVRIEGFNTVDEGPEHLPLGLVVTALAIAGAALVFFYRRYHEEAR